jgi:CHAD domain-containing protein
MAKPSTKPPPKKASLPESVGQQSLTVAEVSYDLIRQQYDCMIQQEQGVLADQDPEYLHQMRVGSRRLRTALQAFGKVVKLPRAAREKHVGALTKMLGKLRDLDVQIAATRENYYPHLNPAEQKRLDKLLVTLEKQRRQALAEVKTALTDSDYQRLKDAYEDWLDHPQYTSIAHLPLPLLLPELLSPLLATLLLHPAWLIPVDDISKASNRVLHDLRKTCKAVRYQAEFFIPFYGSTFQDWIEDMKQLQENLGKVQDAWILRKLLLDELGKKANLPDLEKAMQDERVKALANWETLRHRYLDLDFRCQLHQMILEPSTERFRT